MDLGMQTPFEMVLRAVGQYLLSIQSVFDGLSSWPDLQTSLGNSHKPLVPSWKPEAHRQTPFNC